MSYRVDNIFVIEPEEDGICEQCGVTAETRPYGPGFIRICFECGKKDEEGIRERCKKIMLGEIDA